MKPDPIADAVQLTQLVVELLQRAVAPNQAQAADSSQVRYAQALAHTLLDELTALQRLSEPRWEISDDRWRRGLEEPAA